MAIRFGGTLLAAVTAAFVAVPALSALAQFSPSGFGGAGQATGQGKSNTTDRMGGGGGGKGATAKTTTVKSSKSNTSDRMGGGGGKASIRDLAESRTPNRKDGAADEGGFNKRAFHDCRAGKAREGPAAEAP